MAWCPSVWLSTPSNHPRYERRSREDYPRIPEVSMNSCLNRRLKNVCEREEEISALWSGTRAEEFSLLSRGERSLPLLCRLDQPDRRR